MNDAEYKRLSDQITAAHVEISRRDCAIDMLKADFKRADRTVGGLHEKIGRMGAVNDQLLDSLADLLKKGPIHTYVEAAQRALEMGLAERDNEYGEWI